MTRPAGAAVRGGGRPHQERCPWLGEQWGGPGGDFRMSVVVMEELARVYECSTAKRWQSEMLGEVVDACLQLLEYPISRAYMDARVQRIFAGTNEVMKLIVSKELGL